MSSSIINTFNIQYEYNTLRGVLYSAESCQCIKEPSTVFHLHLKYWTERGREGEGEGEREGERERERERGWRDGEMRDLPQLSKQSNEALACVLSAACVKALLNSLEQWGRQ